MQGAKKEMEKGSASMLSSHQWEESLYLAPPNRVLIIA